MKKYTHKWTLQRSRTHFYINVFLKYLKRKPNPGIAQGFHYIDGPTGGGKTLYMNILLTKLLSNGGFMWANIDEFKNKNAYVFDMEKVWSSGKQNLRLNNYIEPNYCKGIIFDEINRFFNRRANKEKTYNDIFIPMINSLFTHRHDGYPRIYFLGQNVVLQDTQIQSVLKWKHLVSCKYKYYYVYFRNEYKLISAPSILTVEHHKKIASNSDGTPIFKLVSKEKIKIINEYLESFDTHAFSKIIESLPGYLSDKK
jgi:hypothetical protein